METRKITVVASATNSTITFMSNAANVNELKNAFREHNINYNNLDVYEGLSKSKIDMNSNQTLPHDINFKGSTTNELVFYITNSRKHIKSGSMSRQECYTFIKTNNLNMKFSSQYGKSYTNAPTDTLIAFCENNMNGTIATAPNSAHIPSINTPSTCGCTKTTKCEKHVTLFDILRAMNNGVAKEDIDIIIDNLERTTPSYSQEDINQMFSWIK